MKKENGKYIYSPSDLIVYLESQFASWMDRYYLDYPDKITPDAEREDMKILQALGYEHEGRFLTQLKSKKLTICENPKDANTTINAMRSGADIIFQAKLGQDKFAGKADFLVKVDGLSNLGNYHYEVWDTKLAHKTKPYYLIQLLCYAEMFEDIQGRLPEFIQVVLGDKTEQRFRTGDFLYYYRQIKQSFLEFHDSFNVNNKPEPYKTENFGRWETEAINYLRKIDHLSQVANIRRDQVSKLKTANINTVNELSQSTLDHVTKLDDKIFASLRKQARLQIESANLEKPKYELIPQDINNPHRGLALLPRTSPSDVCFDMEGDPYSEAGHEYLFGVTYSNNGKIEFKDWWAYTIEEEQKAFEEFINWIYTRWQHDQNMHIYHYASYETTALKRLMSLYGSRENEIDTLLRNNVFVDLYNMVRQSLKVGEPSYSLKNIEHLYRDKRKGDVGTAIDSVIYFHRWQDNKDGKDWNNSQILKTIRDYNQEDCDSTWQLLEWLRARQAEQGIQWISPLTNKDEEKKESEYIIKVATKRQASHDLFEKLLSEIKQHQAGTDKQLQELLAYLLEYHWREAKPIFWAKYERNEMTEQELYEDITCLANLSRTSHPPEPIKKSYLYEYSFDPNQETKLTQGNVCFSAYDLSIKTTIEEINTDVGIIKLKFGPSQPKAPEYLHLVPDEFVSADAIADSVYRLVNNWHNTGYLPQALSDFLLRKRPRITGNMEGTIVKNSNDLVKETTNVICNLDNSYLCIQGPPGSGKTHTAACAIIELLKRNKTIGITSNSHKAIYRLLQKINEFAPSPGLIPYKAVKAKSSKSNIDEEYGSELEILTLVADKSAALNAIPDKYRLIADTAWGFSNELAKDKLDYLFIDEASQVSLANLVGMAASTKNIVVIGDQMQLSQPTKAVHPGDSGKSILDYLLEEHATVPKDLGIFLDKTRRLHPKICSFISEAVYEGRLHPTEDTDKRLIKIPVSANSSLVYVTKEAGIIYVPIRHEGNTQSSDEEANVIKTIVNELVRCTLKNNTIEQSITLKDIMIVAPYNMQVRNIARLIPGARVGSVDKFQGQEAAVVILSMCSSTADAAARGLDFLLDRHRINVAISRAQTLAIVVGSPLIANTKCNRVEQMELVNLFCRVMQSNKSHRILIR
jgi:uncharacterized protein